MGSSQLLVKRSDKIIAVSNVLAIALYLRAFNHPTAKALKLCTFKSDMLPIDMFSPQGERI